MASVDALELGLGAVEERLLGELRALRKRVRSEAVANGPACKLAPGYVTARSPVPSHSSGRAEISTAPFGRAYWRRRRSSSHKRLQLMSH